MLNNDYIAACIYIIPDANAWDKILHLPPPPQVGEKSMESFVSAGTLRVFKADHFYGVSMRLIAPLNRGYIIRTPLLVIRAPLQREALISTHNYS